MLALVMLALLVDAKPKVIAVPALVPKGVDETTAAAFDDLIVEALARAEIGKIITPGDIKALVALAETRQLQGCDTAQCMAEISQALGAQYAVSGSLTKLGEDTLLLSFAYIATTRADVIARAQRRVPLGGDYAAAVADCVGALVDKPLAAVPTVGAKPAPPASGPVFGAPQQQPASLQAWRIDPAVLQEQLRRRQRDRGTMLALGGALLGAGGAVAAAGIVLVALTPTAASITAGEYARLADAAEGDVPARARSLDAAVANSRAFPIAGGVLVGVGAAAALSGIIVLAAAPRLRANLFVLPKGGAFSLGGRW